MPVDAIGIDGFGQIRAKGLEQVDAAIAGGLFACGQCVEQAGDFFKNGSTRGGIDMPHPFHRVDEGDQQISVELIEDVLGAFSPKGNEQNGGFFDF